MLLTFGMLVTSCQDTVAPRATIAPGKTMDDPDGDEPIDETPARPSNAIFFKDDFCICKDKKAVSANNCATFCSTKSTSGKEVFYANFTTTADISQSGLGSVYGWCTQIINPETETANPKCLLKAKAEGEGEISIDVSIPTNANSLTAFVQDSLSYNKTYILTLVEETSGAKSNSIQLIKYSTDVPIPVVGPLKVAPISQYSCLWLAQRVTEGNVDIYNDGAYRTHFYYLPSLPPDPITAMNVVCHDIRTYGLVDDREIPRFENIPGVINLWDANDPRFYNNNGTGSDKDVNDIIIQKAAHYGGTIPAGTQFFQALPPITSTSQNQQAGNNSTTIPLGYFMSPWIDQTTFKSYCLNSTHYNSNNPLFKAMRDVIEVDTEGLYVGYASEIVGTSTISDYIFIRETDLKAVWFYKENGQHKIPTDANVANVAVYFYYPIDKNEPRVKKSSQRIYQVKGQRELSAMSTTPNANPDGTNTVFPPHDRKVACIPKF